MTTNYYQRHKEKLRKKSREKYQNLSEEEKKTKVEKSLRKISKFN